MSQSQHHPGGGREGSDRRAAEERQIAGAINSLRSDYNAAQQKRTKAEGEQHKWSRRTAKAAILYTVLTGLILGGSVYSIYQTWNAVDAANRAADAATDEARTANDAERRTLRAYIGIQPGDIKDFGTTQQSMTVTRINSGHTPAYDAGFSTVGADIIWTPSNIHTPGGCAKPNIKDMLTIFPNIPEKFALGIWNKGWKSDQFDTISANTSKSEGLVFVYYGTFCYNDAFSVPHYTNFCYMYSGKNMAAADAEACLTHNDSD